MKIPIPSLEHTQESFRRDASIYQSFDKTGFEDFFTKVAPKLQNLLIAYDANQSSSYLHRLWNDSYLSTRNPLSIASNFSFKIPFKCEFSHFVNLMSKLCLEYRLGKLEFKNSRGNSLFPLQFEILKGACRVPQNQIDAYSISQINPCFMSISYKNELFKADVLEGESILKIALDEVLKTHKTKQYSFFDLSKLSSDQASQMRHQHKSFNSFFEVIENSLFHICLIDKDFEDLDQKDFYMHYEAPIYHFKPLNFIYNLRDGEFYVNAEHMFEDGGSIAWILEYIFSHLDMDFGNQRGGETIRIEQFFGTDFEKNISDEIKKYKREIALVKNKRLAYVVKKECIEGMSKDFVAQASIAYASKKAFGKFVSQYEAVDMREYDFGRTECLRAISPELQGALESFTKEDLIQASDAHKGRIKDCKKAMGYDRHLLGLKNLIPCLDEEERKMAQGFFDSQLFADVSQTIVSTSSLGKSEFVDTFFFHPVHQDGFGISYANEENTFFYLCTYFDKDCEKFKTFEVSLKEFFSNLERLRF